MHKILLSTFLNIVAFILIVPYLIFILTVDLVGTLCAKVKGRLPTYRNHWPP